MLKLLLALLVAAGALGAGIAVRLYQESQPVEPIRPTAAPTGFPQLSVQLGRSEGRIRVTNLDDFDWTGCIVDVNAGVPDGGFSRDVGGLGAGQQISLRLETFARADGRRFDEGAQPVQVVDVHCDTPDGPAHFTGGV